MSSVPPYGFWSASIVAAWTALEIFSIEVVVRSLFRALTWPFDELEQYLTTSIFGSNGKLDRLKKMLDKTQVLSPVKVGEENETGYLKVFTDEVWTEVKWIQSVRNGVVHHGLEASEADAGRALAAVRATIESVERYLEVYRPYYG